MAFAEENYKKKTSIMCSLQGVCLKIDNSMLLEKIIFPFFLSLYLLMRKKTTFFLQLNSLNTRATLQVSDNKIAFKVQSRKKENRININNINNNNIIYLNTN